MLYQNYLKNKIPSLHSVSGETILVNPGSLEIIAMLYNAFVFETENILAPNPCFLLDNVCAKMFNKSIQFYDLDRNFKYKTENILKKINQNTKFIIVTSPNNPTETIISKKEMNFLLETLEENQVLFINEAYIEFNDAHDRYDTLIHWVNKKNIVLLRTFSKLYGLAELRRGYYFARNEIMKGFLKILKPFTITSLLSERAACASLDNTAFVSKTLHMVKEAKHYCYKKFTRMHLQYCMFYANFMFLKTSQSDEVYLYRKEYNENTF